MYDAWQQLVDQWRLIVGDYVPNLLAALALLVGGWLVALMLAALVRSAFSRSGLDERIGTWIGGEDAEKLAVGGIISRTVYYLIMLFVVVGFFQILQLTLVVEPLNALLVQLFAFLPRLLGAAAILLLAWFLATLLRRVLHRVLTAARIDERLRAGEGGKHPELVRSISEAVYWLVLLLFLPAVLGALHLQGMLAPVQAMLDSILGFLPNVFAASLILLVGWFAARIVGRVVTNLLAAAGFDQLGERAGFERALGKRRLSGILGLAAHAVILVPVLIAALEALQLEAITRPTSEMLATVLAAVPAVLAAFLVLALAYGVGRIAAGLVANLLTAAGFDRVSRLVGVEPPQAPAERTPSHWAGHLVLVAIMLAAAMESARLLGFAQVADLVGRFMVFTSHLLLGLLVLAVGLYLANLASRLIRDSGAAQAMLLSRAAWVSIVLLATAIGLQQMGLADEIIQLAFGIMLGAVAVAAAVAFGIGGRQIAERHLERWIGRLEPGVGGPERKA